MAPTEVLAEQHHMSLSAMLSSLTVPSPSSLWGDRAVRTELLTNRTAAGERTKLLAGLAGGEVDLIVGTHALLTEAVRFSRLGMVVIDEQHRFGVEQRSALREKSDGPVPDVLVMTATPIPRTAAMTVYGDLDTTVLDELPPGRTPVRTVWARGPLDVEGAWATARDEVAAGHQVYVVCPLVEESERVQAASASEELARLATGPLSGLRLGLLHGQLPASEKQAVMGEFRAGRVQVLVATTVIEVGIDVANATVMVIEDADRFGIAQLHQLRGRVGRGEGESHCFLMAEGEEEVVLNRLALFARTSDGFALAEADMLARGEGQLFGERQSGYGDLEVASLLRDRRLLEEARALAKQVLSGQDARQQGASPSTIPREALRLLVEEAEQRFGSRVTWIQRV